MYISTDYSKAEEERIFFLNLDMVAYACDLNTWGSEAGESHI